MKCRGLSIGAILLAGLLSTPLKADPRIDNLRPHAIQRGTTATIHFYGIQLLDPQDVLFSDPGLQVIELSAYSDRHIAVLVRADTDCRLGPTTFRVCTGRGISNLRAMSVSALPIVEEHEPNNGIEQAELVRLPCTYHGRIQSEDVESIAVDLTVGERLAVEVEGVRIGREFIDPRLTILDPDGMEMVTVDDTMLARQDPFAVLTAQKTGRHVIQVRDARFGGNDLYLYLLHVGHFPRPAYAWPPGGRPGETLEVTWQGLGQPPWQQRVTLPATESPRHTAAFEWQLWPENESGVAPTGVGIRVVDLPATEEVEPNNRPPQAVAMVVPGVARGVIAGMGDQDFFTFPARKGQPLEIEVFARRTLRSRLDPWLQIRDAQGKQVAANDDNAGPDSFIDFNPPADGDYRLLIRDHLKQGGPEYVYQIEITPRTPELVLRTPDRVPYVSSPFSLSRGGRMAVLLIATRRHFGESIRLASDALPPGVTVEMPEIPAGRDRGPIVFHVSPDAPRGGALVSLRGTATIGEREVAGHFQQRTMLVRGANNRDMWGHDADRLAVAVTDESPFSLEIIQPQVPLVRNGSMGLKLVATRREGFAGPITARMIYNPPGVYSRGSVTIPADKQEAVLPLTANNGATPLTSPIVVTATANHEGAPFEVSSQLAQLTVEPSYFNVTFEKANVEQGGQTEMVVKLERTREIPGPTTAELVGLPAGTSAALQTVAEDARKLTFVIRADEKARVGRFATVLCRLVITHNGEAITHILGTGQLRVDKPLAPHPKQT